MLCRTELEVGDTKMELLKVHGTTGIAGDARFQSRSAESEVNAQIDELRCPNKTLSLVVSAGIEDWRGKQILGLSIACAPRNNIERQAPEDKLGVEEFQI